MLHRVHHDLRQSTLRRTRGTPVSLFLGCLTGRLAIIYSRGVSTRFVNATEHVVSVRIYQNSGWKLYTVILFLFWIQKTDIVINLSFNHTVLVRQSDMKVVNRRHSQILAPRRFIRHVECIIHNNEEKPWIHSALLMWLKCHLYILEELWFPAHHTKCPGYCRGLY